MAATSLAALIDARARLAAAELAALQDRAEALTTLREGADADHAALRALIESRARVRDRLLRDALRATTGDPLRPTSDEARLALEEQQTHLTPVAARWAKLSADARELEATLESVAAKEDELRRLEARSRALVRAAPALAQLGVLQELADEATAVAATIAALLHGGAQADPAPLTWAWPVSGTITQRFGPSSLTLEPALTFEGVPFDHFHDGIDIAAPLGSVVAAPAPGRVAFVGHLPDGAMVVVIQHDDGLASLSAHLDDAFAPPPVRAGDRVERGAVIGYVGMTGITTGPHLHFALHLRAAPVDPLAVLSRS
jgi:murein DD-endopeptidase MepM/ murein hydrolase activator NlpD